MSCAVITESQAQDRLRPFMSRGVPALDSVKSQRDPPFAMRAHLARTASLDRIRQFPTYLCSRDFLHHALSYLQTSSSSVQAGLALVRGSLLIVAVYLGLFLLAAQLSACCYTLLLGAKPPGLIFLMTILFAMCGMAYKTILHDSSKDAL